MLKLLKGLDFVFKIVFLTLLVLLASGFVFLNRKVEKLEVLVKGESTNLIGTERNFTDCGPDCQDKISKIVASSVATLSGIPEKEVVAEKETKVAETNKTKQVVYIPLGGSFSTNSIGWVDAKNTEVWLDFNGDYGQKANATWEASLKVDNSNGQAFARLYDVTHAIGVVGSEISTTNNASFNLATSGNLSLWRGRNLYRVQIKSLNSFTVFYDSGRIKIEY